MPKANPLCARARKFVDEYLVDLCAKGAAVRAGYSPKCAKGEGHRLLQDPRVAALVRDRLATRAARVEVKQDEVIRGLAKEAETADQAGARVRAWELLGKHIGMWPTKVEVSGTVTVQHRAQLLERVNKAIAEAQAELMPMAQA